PLRGQRIALGRGELLHRVAHLAALLAPLVRRPVFRVRKLLAELFHFLQVRIRANRTVGPPHEEEQEKKQATTSNPRPLVERPRGGLCFCKLKHDVISDSGLSTQDYSF